MALSAQQNLTHTDSPLQTPSGTGDKFWANDLTWKTLSNQVVKFPLVCDTITTNETLIIPSTYQFIIEGTLHNNGIIENNGKVVIL